MERTYPLYRPFNPAQPDPKAFTRVIGASNWEHQYLHMMHMIMMDGNDRIDRTGAGTRSLLGERIRIDLQKYFPMVTTKFVGLKSVISELLWFLEGSSDERRLAELLHGTRDASKLTIWTDNLNADYWRGKSEFEGDLGRIYGVQWRQWATQDGTFLDQIAELIKALRTDPTSRRMIVSAWNPGEFKRMVLPPCHMAVQFHVRFGNDGRKFLNCQMYQRSADVFLGVPFNIASYAALTHMIAHVTGMEVGELTMVFGDAHIYSNHFEQVELQLDRLPHDPPQLRFNNPESLKELSDFTMDSFVLEGYTSHPSIKAPMAV